MNEDHISLKLPPEKEKEKEESEEKEFTMYVMDISYFSGKLECYFNFQVVSPFLLFTTLLCCFDRSPPPA